MLSNKTFLDTIWEFLHSLPICHHIPEKSKLFGLYLPLCCRCTGIYTFIILSFVINVVFKISYKITKKEIIVLTTLALFTGIEAIIEMIFNLDLGNLVRFITGAVSGLAIGTMLKIGIFGK